MTINFASDIPIYQQVAGEIEDAILSGAFGEDLQVPSTNEIAITYKINPATVLKGMTLLVDAGVLYKRRGLGMFVSRGAVEMILGKRREDFYRDVLPRFLQEAEKLGITRQELAGILHANEAEGNQPKTDARDGD